MAPQARPHAHGSAEINGIPNGRFVSKRFSNIPPSLDIVVGDQEDEAVEIDLRNLVDDPSELCQLLDAENAARDYWLTVGLAYAKLRKPDCAIEMLVRGANAMGANSTQSHKLPLVTALCWMYLYQSREAPRHVQDQSASTEAKNKEHYLQLATSTLNEATRTHSSYSPLHLARGVLQLLKASLKLPTKANQKTGGTTDAEKSELLNQALKSFQEAIRASGGNNMMAVMGKARVFFAQRKYPEALQTYQEVLRRMPEMKSFRLDKNHPLTCATFGNYFLSRKNFDNVEALANKAIQYTDVHAIASDGWYLLARKEHYANDLGRAADYYRRADEARGGAERGLLPAKLGSVQLLVIKNELGEAKLQLEKMIQQSKNYESMVLLGTLYAEEVFASMSAPVREDKTSEAKKAISLLESVRASWKDPKKNVVPDAAVLLNLARLYETENPEKALQCLQQVENLELGQITESDRPSGPETGKHEQASEMFEAAADSCVRIDQSDEDMDTDALVTTITYNLGRSYESRGMSDKAVEVYEGLLERHEDYVDARARLAYIKLRKTPNKEGPDAVAKLYQSNPSDLEVRALYGWFLGKVSSKKRPANVAEDPELRHYKHTLQNYDKHDRYALVGMGNMYLTQAREMRRDTEQDKHKRSATYARAVEFFEKALQLDPKNAYAAQGVAIALVEDKKDHKAALQIFLKVRETIKDAHIFVNLGHIYAELRQFSKAIESYEHALSKEGKENDAGILSCLGRTWLSRGRAERSLEAYKTALEYAQKALAVAPEQVHFQFNVAFVQIQIAMMINALGETQRSSFQLEDAAQGLEAAIKTLEEIAGSEQPPYPKHDIEQRANMARNTQRKQLERAIASQKEYEAKNKERLAAALRHRQAELRRREEARQKVEEQERQRQERIRKDREIIAARDRELAEKRAEEERARLAAEMTTDSETGEKIRRKKRPAASRAREGSGELRRAKGDRAGRSRRKKRADDDGEEGGERGGDDDSAGEERRPKKKQRLTSRKETNATKYKSAEIVVDSDESGDEPNDAKHRLARNGTPGGMNSDDKVDEHAHVASDPMDIDSGEKGDDAAPGASGAGAGATDNDDDEAEAGAVARPKRARRGRVIDDDDDDDDDGGGGGGGDENAKNPEAADASMADPAEDE
ncbi:hypothetical protein P8C59_003803 [Phyllachora maydis]|uniref:Uncharacterized protein n=1 Tax=Phyllachora maydis TaxID=1825666 RepID=A0AAD9I2N8_9PEZI|nr:hypothetical protein P8C59_003803 [Phyllachora maydis]